MPGRRARASASRRAAVVPPVPGGRRAARRAEAARSSSAVRFKTAVLAAGVVTAGSGLAAAATLPGSGDIQALGAGQPAVLEQSSAASALTAAVGAPPEARVDFSRQALAGTARAGESTDASVMSSNIRSAGKQGGNKGQSRAGLAGPLDQLAIASPFGYRANPLGGYGTSELHAGIDYAGACGTRVKAASSGTVVEAGWHAYGGGQRIVVDHGGGLKTTYNHLSVIGVAVGQKVAQGEQVGAVGTTGNSTGCHLHFEVMVNDVKVDPLGWL
jgi:murein DD-endopeptidase MepM/ murein hydrolase activator NlpD